MSGDSEETSAKRKTASRQKLRYSSYWLKRVYIYEVYYSTPNNSADLALMIISVQTAGEKIVEGTPKKALVVSSLAK